jgi:hypothetical protein
MEKPFYVLRTSEIFPYDCEQPDFKVIRKNIKNTLRPEFFIEYEQFLKADTLKDY